MTNGRLRQELEAKKSPHLAGSVVGQNYVVG